MNPNYCVSSEGTIAQFQERARRARLEYTGMIDSVWTWFTNTCQTTNCLFSGHIEATSPVRIAYPSFVCIYCGRLGGARDHLLPLTLTGKAQRKYVATVPTCTQCNSAINDLPDHNIHNRRAVAHGYIRRKYGKHLTPRCSLVGLEGNLLKYVQAGDKNAHLIEAMLAWPEDPFYDLRAFQKSGIEDPYAVGLI